MKTRAAVLRKAGTPWEITELELDPPKASEALARTGASDAGGRLLIGYHRKMQGSLFGGANPLYDIPMILSLWPRWPHQAHGTRY
jgi:Zn-dependent alcohol dehydrogenase